MKHKSETKGHELPLQCGKTLGPGHGDLARVGEKDESGKDKVRELYSDMQTKSGREMGKSSDSPSRREMKEMAGKYPSRG